ncbi:MAG: T9SS type A sorting domain-containing protein [Saprospiraceae bacterium]|nr:T9SS type A sorting domain-containing protein [Saprospiraceae bacterium]
MQVHYYDHIGVEGSPFHYPASHWGVDKPIVIGEFPAGGIQGFTAEECYQYAYRLGYAGALAWSYSDIQFGGLPVARSGMLNLLTDYPDDIIVPDTSATVAVRDIPAYENARIFPNPVTSILNVEISDIDEPTVILEILNMQGQSLKKESFETAEIIELNLSLLPGGNYMLRLTGNNKSGIMRLVKL